MRAGWNLWTQSGPYEDPAYTATFQMGTGIYTMLDLGGTAITPIAHPSDTAPPSQRWVHWRVMSLVPSSPGAFAPNQYWSWVAGTQPSDIDVQAMVAASAAELLTQFSWEVVFAPPSNWTWVLTWWASCLVS